MTVTPSTLRPLPIVEGTTYFTPYASFRFPIEDFDYVEEEWIASGVENGHTYETTVLVRRPRDRSRFSGTVLVEPLHAHGIAPMSLYCSTYVMRSGHGWAMVTSQRSTIHDHVRNANPERYESLHINGPGDGAPATDFSSTNAMVGFWTRVKEINRASSTILAQVGAALRHGAPFDGAAIDHVILMGHSQTGSVVTYYIQEAHEAERLADGRPVYDGYAPTGFPVGPFGPCDVPIVQVMSDGDVSNPDGTFIPGYEGRPYRRADSDDPADRYRLYELAGVPHMGTRYFPFDDITLWQQTNPESGLTDDAVMNTLPHNELFNACLRHLVEWVANGTTPPRAPRIDVADDGFFASDDYGNTTGGIRCVQMDVPRARYFPNVPRSDGSLTIATIGTEAAFDADALAARYGDADGYRKQFEARLDELVAEGWLLPDDVAYMRDDFAKVSDF